MLENPLTAETVAAALGIFLAADRGGVHMEGRERAEGGQGSQLRQKSNLGKDRARRATII